MRTLPYTQEQLRKLLAGETVVRRFPVKPSEMHHDYTGDGDPFPDKSQCTYQKGQRRKVGEEWGLHHLRLHERKCLYSSDVMPSHYLYSSVNWQPAETMPPKFARHEVEVVGVDCKRWQDVPACQLPDIEGDLNTGEWTFGIETKLLKKGEG